jgi:hypothetical protein
VPNKRRNESGFSPLRDVFGVFRLFPQAVYPWDKGAAIDPGFRRRMKLPYQGTVWPGVGAPNACRSMLAEKLLFDTRSGLFLLLYQGTTLVVPNSKWIDMGF